MDDLWTGLIPLTCQMWWPFALTAESSPLFVAKTTRPC